MFEAVLSSIRSTNAMLVDILTHNEPNTESVDAFVAM